MSRASRGRYGDHSDHPRSDRVRHPRRYLLHPLRPLARWIIRRRFQVHLHGLEHIPATGPVIFAGNHVGVADGPLLAIFAPRPVHALTKVEMFRGLLGPFLRHSGQIPLDRYRSDPAAVRACVRVLRDGGAVGIFPEGSRGAGDFERFHRGTAYLALVSGAPVVPVVTFGSREPGGRSGSIPRRGGRVDLVFGPPHHLPPSPWPRGREQVEGASLLLWEHLRSHLDRARASTGLELPGPLPPGDMDPDPATGVTEQGAT